ncbi:MAG: MarR family transcriptional regulator [Rhodospirillales bacterium]|nr:MarR family transcriptional regulator [Rhodospirillales bacterium]MDE2574086.1 MarR family transcriptional regulator [Rhodospirillales bacterium]
MPDNHSLPPTPAIALGPLEGSIGYALRRAQLAVFHDFHAAMAEHDIRTAQFSVLEVLRHNPGLRQREVSAVLGIKTANFVPLFDALERRDLAERQPIAGDRRARGLHLTRAGQALLDRLEAVVGSHEARFANRIGAAGKAQLLGLLHRLTDPAFDP